MHGFDNVEFRVNGAGATRLAQALGLALGSNKVERYAIHPTKGFILYWTPPETPTTTFPFKMAAPQIAEFIHEWLKQSADYGSEPDIDGSCERGWTVYTESWGHVNEQWEAFLAVKPTWILYGK